MLTMMIWENLISSYRVTPVGERLTNPVQKEYRLSQFKIEREFYLSQDEMKWEFEESQRKLSS